MKNSDVIKVILLTAINEIAADYKKYAVNPSKDLPGNRKLKIGKFEVSRQAITEFTFQSRSDVCLPKMLISCILISADESIHYGRCAYE